MNESLTWIPNSIYDIGAGKPWGNDFNAWQGWDTVTLGWKGAGGPTVEHVVIFNVNPATPYWLGVFGLSPYPTNFTNYQNPQSSYLNALATNHTIPSMTYGYTAGNQYRLNNLKVYGSLTLGGYDQNRFQPTNISFPMYQDISKDLSVSLLSVTTDSGSPSNLLPGGQIQMFIDSTIPQIWLPVSACQAFEQAFGLTYTQYTDGSGYYLINDTQRQSLLSRNANVTFTIAGTAGGPSTEIVLPYGAFDLQLTFPLVQNPNTSYYFPLQRAQNNTQYVFGRTFLQEAYIIADYDRGNFTVAPCLWDVNKVNTPLIKSIYRANETANGSDSSGPGVSGGAIAGIVIGIVAAIALLGLLLFFLRRRKNTQKQRLAELESKNAAAGAADSGSDSAENKPFVGNNELGGEQVHELTGFYKPSAQELDSPYKTDPNRAGYSEMEAGSEYYGPGKPGHAAEMEGNRPIFEMPGSDVQEMPAPIPGRDVKF